MRIATIWSKVVFGFGFMLCASNMNAQQMIIDVPNDLTSININQQTSVYYTEQDLNSNEALTAIQKGQMLESQQKVTQGFSTDFFWIIFSIKNNAHLPILLELNNPHIDYSDFYQIKKDSAILLGSAGDRLNFDIRPVINRRIIYPLPISDTSHFLLKVDKRYASVSFPLTIYRLHIFESFEKRADLIYGFYFGVLMFISFISLLVGFGLSDKVFLSYSGYVFLVALYIFTQLGFSHQFIFPNHPDPSSYIRVLFAALVTVSAMDFFSKLLKVNSYLPTLHSIYRWTILTIFILIAFWFINKAFSDNYYIFTIPLLNVLYVIILFLLVSIGFVVYKTWAFQKRILIIYTISFAAIFIGAFLYILVEYGLIPESNFPLNPVLIGSIMEIMILSIAMIYRVKEINDNKNELTLKMANQQKELMRAFVRGAENERSRVSSELHDNIGSSLSLLRRKIENETHDSLEIKSDIDNLCQDVRDLSHKLVPHEMQVAGFLNTTKSYIRKFKKNTGINVEISAFGFPPLHGEMALHIFRLLQEALHNIEKHAKATEVDIQLIGYEEELVITIDDDGVGFDLSKNTKGLGLETMKSRVDAFSGTFEIASYPNKGTNILVKIPVSPTKSQTSRE
jgi:two-component system, sensor histidine kinase LadS